MQDNVLTPGDYIQILKRRRWSLILPFVSVFLMAFIIAVMLPPVYKSVSTILIEEQEIPSDFVITTVTSYAEQRLMSINQRIMSASRLMDIINRFNLYKDKKDRWTNEEIIEKMRQDVKMEPISAEVTDRRTGRPSTATTAFTLSFEGTGDPVVIQRVADRITSLFLEENQKVRARQTSETSKFIENEMLNVKTQLTEIEKQIAAFKEKHINELPELFQVNMQSLNNIEVNLDRAKEQLRSLKEREGSLQTQIAAIISDSKNLDKKRLDELRLQMVYLKTRFSDQYPDVVKIGAEIAEIEKKLSNTDRSLKKHDDREDNPAYISMRSQLSATQADIESVNRQIRDLDKKSNDYRNRIEATPRIEEQYKAIAMEQINTKAKYDDLMRKLMESKVAEGLEKEQKGERFTLIDAARLPEKPYKPNRLAIILIGVVLGIGAGVGLAAVIEFSDDAVRSEKRLVSATSFPVLSVIPKIITETELARQKFKVKVFTLGVLVCAAGGLAVFHFVFMDLNVFWAKLMRKLVIF